jgi:hypothetical protein
MNEYIRTYGEPKQRKVRTHICYPGGDATICGTDIVGDTTVHQSPPVSLPFGRRYRVTCEHCRRIIDAVRDHLSPNADLTGNRKPGKDVES